MNEEEKQEHAILHKEYFESEGFKQFELFIGPLISFSLRDIIGQDNIKELKDLISSGADINKPTSLKSGILEEALIFRDLGLIKFLVEAGADVNAKSPDGGTSVLHAALVGSVPQKYRPDDSKKYYTIFKYLMENGGKWDLTIYESNVEPYGYFYDWDTHQLTQTGDVSLMDFAIKYKHKSAIKLLNDYKTGKKKSCKSSPSDTSPQG